MKKYLIYIYLCSTLGLGACQKQLQEDPKSFLTPTQFFKSDKDAIQAVNGAYFWLVGSYPQRLFQQELWEYLDEDCDAIRRPSSAAVSVNGAPYAYAGTIWNGCYRGVYAATQVIDKVSKSGDSDIKKRTVGEARFLRALYYYYLTNIYGDAPLIDEKNYEDTKATAQLGRASVADIRKLMVSDLDSAVAVLPDKYESATDKGRATKGAAQTLLIKTYLWEKNWTQAVKVAKDIVASGTYKLLPNYADVFSSDNEFNQESIFEIDFQKDLLDSYQHAFYSPKKDVGVEPFSSNAWYGSYVPYKSFAGSFAANDKRKAAEIAVSYNGSAFKPDTKNKVDVWFGPKWWRLDADERNSGLDIYLFRYADVLLMLSEAANEAGDMPTAYNAINQVRERAGLNPLANLTQDQLRTDIRQERNWELCGEGHRKLDLVRWGIWANTAKAAASPEEPIVANSYQSFQSLLPIPADEISKNHNLKQNPGW